MLPDPLVSVLMVVRHGGPFLDRALASLVQQTLQRFEIIVVTNRADEDTLRTLADWCRREPRLRVFAMDEGGIARCANHAASLARAPLLARLDADDIALPQRLEHQVARFEATPELGLLGSAVGFIDAQDRIVSHRQQPHEHDEIVAFQTHHCAFIQSSVMMRRVAFQTVGGYRAGMRLAEDYDLWRRLSERVQVANLPDELTQYRIHDDNVTRTRAAAMAISWLCVRAAARARERGQPEPFRNGVPVLRSAAHLLGLSRTETRDLLRGSILRTKLFWIVMRSVLFPSWKRVLQLPVIRQRVVSTFSTLLCLLRCPPSEWFIDHDR